MFSLSAQKTIKKVLTYQERQSGAVVYKHTKPGSITPFEASQCQKIQRAIFGCLVAEWKKFTDEEKAEWNEKAKQAKFVGTGYHYFMSEGCLEYLVDTILENIPYGELNYHGEGINLVAEAQDTWYKFEGFNTISLSKLMTVSIEDQKITILKTGIYQLSLSISVSSATGDSWDTTIFKNGGLIEEDTHLIHQTTAPGGKEISTSVTILVLLEEEDEIDMRVQRTTGGVASKTLTLGHVVFNASLIGVDEE